VWYAKNTPCLKYHQLYVKKEFGEEGGSAYSKIELKDGARMSISEWEKINKKIFSYDDRPDNSKIFSLGDLTSQGGSSDDQPFEFNNEIYRPKKGNHWKANYPDGMNRLKEFNRIGTTESQLGYIRYFEDFPYMEINNLWKDTLGQNQYGDGGKKYVVQTSLQVIQRCMLMSTDPGDLVLDITCGSGTTAYVAEQWGRRRITCDTSRIAIVLTKQRMLTAAFDYYELLHPEIGVSGGFVYKKVPHITLKSIANNEPCPIEDIYDQPNIDKLKVRITGPFTVEAIPSPTVKSLTEPEITYDATSKQSDWRDELKHTGIRTRNGEKIEFSRVDPLSGTKYIQADAETSENPSRRAVICFADETRPLDSRIVKFALDEVETIRPSPKIVIFCAFQFDPEAAKDIEETNWPGITLLKVQMNPDLLIEDLKKKNRSNESFWMIGQPDVISEKVESGKYKVVIRGFDYYDVKNGTVESGNTSRIAMWMLDTAYDGMSLNPSQIFFPMAGPKDGWYKLAKTLRTEIDQDLIEMYHGTESIPFTVKSTRKIAVKIIDDRGIESMKVWEIEGSDE